MTNNKLTDAALDECKKRLEAQLVAAEVLGNEYQALNIAATISALTELQERRKAEPALYCMVVDGRIDPEYASLSRAVVAAWVDEWVAAEIGHEYKLVELYEKGV